MAETLGLRERKKQRTHETIVRAGIDLFLERGFQATTVADIAALAEVAPSTVFAYFPTKEDILFDPFAAVQEGFRARMEGRAAGESALEALRNWALEVIPPMFDTLTADKRALRQVIDADPRLQTQERMRISYFEELLVRELAQDLGTSTEAAVVRIVAGAVIGGVGPILSDSRELPIAEREANLRLAFTFAEAGLAAVERAVREMAPS